MKTKRQSKKLKICRRCEHFKVTIERKDKGYDHFFKKRGFGKPMKQLYSCAIKPPKIEDCDWWVGDFSLPKKEFCKQEPPVGCPYILEITIIEQRRYF